MFSKVMVSKAQVDLKLAKIGLVWNGPNDRATLLRWFQSQADVRMEANPWMEGLVCSDMTSTELAIFGACAALHLLGDIPGDQDDFDAIVGPLDEEQEATRIGTHDPWFARFIAELACAFPHPSMPIFIGAAVLVYVYKELHERTA